MDQTKASERLMFRMDFRRELIDKAERRIEHEKSMIKNYKAQIKEMYPQYQAACAREQEVSRYNFERKAAGYPPDDRDKITSAELGLVMAYDDEGNEI